MSNEGWLNIDGDHIVSVEPVTVDCDNCGKRYMYIRDRCPFCEITINSFITNGNTFYIRNHGIYSRHNGQWYVFDDATHENVPVQPNETTANANQQFQQPKPQRQPYGLFDMLNDMVSTTITVAILFILFVAIVYFVDVHIFHRA